jgi:hypothetical protein
MENCKCETLIKTRFKDLIIDCEKGEKTVTIYIEHCSKCGTVYDLTQK